ncbi:outer membrane beta-barrel protein [Pseudoxanthobacter sp. M-2]|uniref:outer membrane protein n=1 Tax=Pseudoxanthobacter sp. M-2 TaxID=3078754 RepID=UPI0038FBEA5A
MPSSRPASSVLLVLLLTLAAPAVAATASVGPEDDVVARAIAAADAGPEDQDAAPQGDAQTPDDGQAPVLQHDDDILPEDSSRAGFYVRGDIGAALFATPTARLPAPVGRFRSPSIDPSVTFGAGLGYDFGGFLRTDVTLDAVGSGGFSARSVCAGCAGGGFTRERADVSALAALLNAYVEFDGVVRPYVGGGIGVSRIEATDWRTTRPDGRTGKRPDAEGWNFAWALAGGVGFDVADTVTLDAGYRYLALGSAETGRTAIGGGGGRGRAKLEDIAVHQVRLGVRVRFP